MLKIVTKKDISDKTLDKLLTLYELSRYDNCLCSKKEAFLLGRLAVKKVICQLLGNNYNFLDIEIRYEKKGRPYLRLFTEVNGLNLGKNRSSNVSFSIAHTRDRAVAVAEIISDGTLVGVDIEKIRSFSESTTRSFLTTREYEKYTLLSVADRGRYTTIMWCLKEAYMKATGEGLAIHPGKIEILFMRNECQRCIFLEVGKKVLAQGEWLEDKDEFVVTKVNVKFLVN